jgi:Tfp pilus assembly protein PilF
LAYVQSADPDPLVTIEGLAMVEQFAGHFDQSSQMLEPHINKSMPFEPMIETMAENDLEKQESRSAIERLKEAPQAPDAANSRQALLAVAYAKAGERAKAIDGLQRTLQSIRQGYPLHYEAAVIYTALDEHESALEMLETASEERESGLIFLNVDPLLAPIRSEPRFQQLLKHINLR